VILATQVTKELLAILGMLALQEIQATQE